MDKGTVNTTSSENIELKSSPKYFWKNNAHVYQHPTAKDKDEMREKINTVLHEYSKQNESIWRGGTYDGDPIQNAQNSFTSNSTILVSSTDGTTSQSLIHNDVITKEKLISKEEDNVNHPKHYNTEVFPQVIDMMLQMFTKDEVMAFCRLNSFKYRMRCGIKNSDKIVEDIEKAMWYETKYIELNQQEENPKQILKG